MDRESVGRALLVGVVGFVVGVMLWVAIAAAVMLGKYVPFYLALAAGVGMGVLFIVIDFASEDE